MKPINKDLYDSNAALYVLSALLHNPLLIQDDRFAITKTDFGQPIQQIIFTAAFNMAQNGFSSIGAIDIDLYLKQFENLYDYYTKNKGYELIGNLLTLTSEDKFDENQFQYYYDRLKKFSILRDLQGNGFDISTFYNPDQDFDKLDLEDEKLNKMPLREIPEHIRRLLVQIENKHLGKQSATAQTSDKNARTLVEELRKFPEVGLPLDGEIWNFATRGARLGKLYTYSAPSGGGKTRHMVGNACAISLPYLDENGKVIMRENLERVVFIATEMSADEIQTLIISYISGVNEEKLLLGNANLQELDRIDKAVDILEQFGKNFIIEAIPDPSIAMIKTIMTRYIIQEGIQYIFYDYIFSSPGLLNEFRDINVREDVALMMLSNTLKEVAMIYHVFIESATQLNDGWSKKEVGPRDQNCIRGSKAIADKIDIGAIGVKITEASEEYKKIQTILTERKLPMPNIVIDIYKNRRGKINNVKIFRKFDFGTCRSEDILITDANYNWKGEDVGKLIYEKRSVDFLDLITRKDSSKHDEH